MIVFRIGHPKYINDLSGAGAALQGGRWNSQGLKVVYTAETSSLAILELLTHIRGTEILPYKLIQISLPDSQIKELFEITDPLPNNWTNSENGLLLTRKIGDHWIKNNISVALKVPSIHTPFEANFLINPSHPDFKPEVMEQQWYLYDYRLT